LICPNDLLKIFELEFLIVREDLDELLLNLRKIIVDDLFGFGGIKLNQGFDFLCENVTESSFIFHDCSEFFFVGGIFLLNNEFGEDILKELEYPDSKVRFCP